MARSKRRTEPSLIKQVRSQKVIWKAWQAIRENGRSSVSIDTQNEIRRFDEDAVAYLQSLMGRLSRGSYQFSKAKGIEKKRPAKADRPIVMAPVENRIVQRAILDVIQSQQQLESLFRSDLSFGGIQGRGVRQAVETAQKKLKLHASAYYVCSDISGFFTAIRRQEVVDSLREKVREEKFVDLFSRALDTELENMATIKDKSIFPLHEIGVAQGCCLSPLVGNIYLKEFDDVMNTDDVFCLRYIDDFLIVGPSQKVVRHKFSQALKLLQKLGLSAYDPAKNPDKAHEGLAAKGFDYLGCTILPNAVRPSTKGWDRLRSTVKAGYGSVLSAAAKGDLEATSRINFASVVTSNSRRIEGWIKQYGFCSNEKVINDWNRVLQGDLLEFENQFFRLIRNRENTEQAQLIGLCDMKVAFREQQERLRSRASNADKPDQKPQPSKRPHTSAKNRVAEK